MGLAYRAGGCNANKLIYKTEPHYGLNIYVLTADAKILHFLMECNAKII